MITNGDSLVRVRPKMIEKLRCRVPLFAMGHAAQGAGGPSVAASKSQNDAVYRSTASCVCKMEYQPAVPGNGWPFVGLKVSVCRDSSTLPTSGRSCGVIPAVGITLRAACFVRVQGIAGRLLWMALNSVVDVAARWPEFPSPARYWPIDIDRDRLHHVRHDSELRPATASDALGKMCDVCHCRWALATCGCNYDRQSFS